MKCYNYHTPGNAWHNAGKGVTTEYTTNPPGSVKRYVMTNTSTCAFTQQGYYGTATLIGEKTTDEDGKTIEIFKDLMGNTVLERRGGNNDTLTVEFDEYAGIVVVSIIDEVTDTAVSQTIGHITATANTVQTDISTLPDGNYTLSIVLQTGDEYEGEFTIQRE